MCGGNFVQQVNKANTRCADKSRSKECYVAEIDWSALQLTAEQIGAAQSQALLLRGNLIEKQFGDIGKLGVFVVSEAWQAATTTPVNGPYFRTHLNGVRCIAAPCPSITEEKLNTRQLRNLAGVDLSQVGASEVKLNTASERLSLPDGILVTGKHKTVKGPAGKALSLIATQFYLPVTASTKQCYVGGCSGQLCGDQPNNMVTDCAYNPGFACYSTASCEQQTDGNCGWTPSKELTDCLNNSLLTK
jgi:hypothetical protein